MRVACSRSSVLRDLGHERTTTITRALGSCDEKIPPLCSDLFMFQAGKIAPDSYY